MALGKKAFENRAKRIKELEAQKDEIQKEIDALKNELKESMDDLCINEYVTDDYILRYTDSVRNTVDSKKLKEEFKDVYIACLKQNPVRTFRIDKNTSTAKRTA